MAVEELCYIVCGFHTNERENCLCSGGAKGMIPFNKFECIITMLRANISFEYLLFSVHSFVSILQQRA